MDNDIGVTQSGRQTAVISSRQWRGVPSSVLERTVMVTSVPHTEQRKCSDVSMTSVGSGSGGAITNIRSVLVATHQIAYPTAMATRTLMNT